MNITYFFPNSLDKNKVGPILEQIKLSQNNNDSISIITCGKGVKTCSINPYSNKFICNACCNNFNRIFKKFDFLDNVKIFDLNSIRIDVDFSYLDSEDLDKLSDFQKLNYDEGKLDVGWSIVSTYVSATRDISEKLTNSNKKRLLQSYKDCVLIYEKFNTYIRKYSPDVITIFNGRLFETRPVLRISQKLNVDCSVLEISGYKGKNWVIYKNAMPHDLDTYSDMLLNLWVNNKNNKNRDQIAERFFHLRRNGGKTNDRSHIDQQKINLLPASFDKTKKNITIFNSSEDEIFSIGPDWKKKFDSQKRGILEICNLLKDYKNFHVYLRIHPNLRNVDSEFLRELLELNYLKNLTIIEATSPISSYALLDNSCKVITFGSTIGVESTYWGKPSLILSDCFYSKIDAAYSVFNKDLKSFLIEDIIPKSKENALKYGFYQMEIGQEFKYWKRDFFDKKKIPSANIFEKITYNIFKNLNE